MADLKQKFLDILFEDDPDDIPSKPVEYTEPLRQEVKHIDVVPEKPAPKNDINIKASDVLYRKPSTSTFINLNEPKRDPVIEDIVSNDEYELSSQISPIFGVIRESKRTTVNPNEIKDSQIKKPDDSHLDIITSPIYGYGNRDDSYFTSDLQDEDKTLHELFDEQKEVYSYNQDSGDDEDISLFKLFDTDK